MFPYGQIFTSASPAGQLSPRLITQTSRAVPSRPLTPVRRAQTKSALRPGTRVLCRSRRSISSTRTFQELTLLRITCRFPRAVYHQQCFPSFYPTNWNELKCRRHQATISSPPRITSKPLIKAAGRLVSVGPTRRARHYIGFADAANGLTFGLSMYIYDLPCGKTVGRTLKYCDGFFRSSALKLLSPREEAQFSLRPLHDGRKSVMTSVLFSLASVGNGAGCQILHSEISTAGRKHLNTTSQARRGASRA